MALVFAIYLTHRTLTAADFQRRQRDRITRIAHGELRSAIRRLNDPFFEALRSQSDSPSPALALVPNDIRDPTTRSALASAALSYAVRTPGLMGLLVAACSGRR